MTGFSWAKLIIQADKNILRQAKTLAKKGQAQYKLDHPDEVRDANQGNYTKFTLRIKTELEKKRKTINDRREIINRGKR